jgi:hypothetical protein
MRVTRASLAQAIRSVPIKPGYIGLTGGLDQVTPAYEMKPGRARRAQNFEVDVLNGYRRSGGYERYDGRPSPSDGTYSLIGATITGTVAVGDTLTGLTSAATGVIVSLPGSSFVLTKVVGTFVNGESLQISAVTVATSTSAAIEGGASTTKLHAQYLNAAADEYRDDIAAAAGSGVILGGFYLNDINYCFRNNAGGTAAVLFKKSSSGWTAVTMYNEISFTAGAVATPADGATLTQGGVTATVKRVVTQSGAWTGAATGRFIITNPGGGNFAAGAATLTGGATCTLSAVQTAITLLPSGRYEHVKENFSGSANATRVYGCDGVNRGFEFDTSEIFVPIATGMTTDTPSHVVAHKKQLFFSFGGSVQHAAPGTPYIWSAILGASELAMGDTVTGFAGQPGDSSGAALAIFTRNRTSILYGSGVANWQLTPYRDELGAWAYTIQDVGYSMFLDDRGITNVQTSQAFGNFQHNAITNAILPLMVEYKPYAIASSICRDKSQYRLFFSSGYAFYVTVVGQKIVGIMPQLFADVVRCTWTAEKNDGNEVMFFGSDSGMVYQFDKGTSHDGDDIEFFIELAYNFFGSPREEKTYHDATIEVTGSSYVAFDFGYSLGYGSTDIPQPNDTELTSSFTATRWDSFTWDAFFWDGTTLSPSTADMRGNAENVSISIRGNADYFQSFTLAGILVHYAQRRRMG